MASSADQARIDDLLTRTGMNDREVGELIGVSQPTVWRLRNGRIRNVSRHMQTLERHLGLARREPSDAEMIADLVGYARGVPALREALQSLHRLMHNYE